MKRIINHFCFAISLLLICCMLNSCIISGGTEDTSDNTTTSKITETTEGALKLKSLTVASYNIRHGEDVSLDMSILAQDLINIGADIVGLQEVDMLANRSGNIDTMKLLAEKGGYEYYKFSKSINIKGGGYGTGILSKYPIMQYNTFTLPSGTFEQRTFGHAVIDVNGDLINFFNTHLSYENADVRQSQFKALAEKQQNTRLLLLLETLIPMFSQNTML